MPAALGAGAIALISWNLTIGTRVSSLPGASRALRAISGVGAFLLVPALVIGVLAPSAAGARVLGPLAWLWPAVVLVIAIQGILALAVGRASRIVAAPLVLFNLLAAWVALAHWVENLGGGLPAWILAPGMAVSSLAAMAAGGAAFPWGASLLIPALVPATPPRSRGSRVGQTLMSVCILAATAVAGFALPGAYRALTATHALEARTMDAASRAPLAIGVRVFGTLRGSPTATTARRDLALGDSLGVSALHVTLAPEGTGPATLDSLARRLEPRRDSVTLVVTMALGADPSEFAGDAARRHLERIERVVRRLRPEVLLPSEGVAGDASGVALDTWKAFYTRAADAARRADRRTLVALATAAETPTDSTLVDWVLRGGTHVDAIAVAVRDQGADPSRFVEALDAMARWVSLAGTAPDVWIVGIPAAPSITGEIVQQRLVRHALRWAATKAWVRGVIAGDASDITHAAGLRTAAGRARRALADVGAALRAQHDAPLATPALDSAAAPAALPDIRRPVVPDTLILPAP